MADMEVFNIRPYLIFRYFFGYYHNIIKPGNRFRYILKTVSVLFVILICYISTLCKNRIFGVLGLFSSFVQYIINITCSLYTEDEYILEYYKYNPMIDDKRNKKPYAILRVILTGYIVVVVGTHLVFYFGSGVLLTLQNENPCIVSWQYHFMGTIRLAMCLGRLPMLAVFGLLYCRVHIFCGKVREHISKSMTMFRYEKYMEIYENIRTTLHKTDFPLKFLLFTQLCLEFLDISNVQYKMVTKFSIPSLLTSSIHFISSLVVFFPCLIMEIISEDLENMRIMVADKMISCVNNRQGNEYYLFLQSLRQRPMTYVIWRAYKMDFRLLLSYISLLITYLKWFNYGIVGMFCNFMIPKVLFFAMVLQIGSPKMQ